MSRVKRSALSRGTAPLAFAEARAAACQAEAGVRAQAAKTVAGHSLDAGDCDELLRMLGLIDPFRTTGGHSR
ncbi:MULTISPECIES: hypothetical protein [Actinokineospora]|uniref:Uncharacterized protein n=1 Tax=Actinokineospora fastidiosa TaxID=1816 RepID=A0A918GK56_9PSEU|nr:MULTISPECIES: hypothetical protein [Actinokineospora]UVS77576.1 hypothetical protein Actkin_01291 [Actinokineospora sp. UTMC 2448]GGS42419.1 hypothetical protein GCM10010171_41600 [Actinokineospora fastidiosa]